MPVLPMFPLSMVLFPGMPLSLRVFEPRYLELMKAVLPEPREFGVVLIERGHEVGGGDQRFGLGTVARIAGLQPVASWLEVVGVGDRRFEVLEWLGDEPYPRADVRWLPEPVWREQDADTLVWAEAAVRRSLAAASEFTDLPFAPDTTIPGEGIERAWRLAGLAPLTELDQQSLLAATSGTELLQRLIALVEDAGRAGGLPAPDTPGAL